MLERAQVRMLPVLNRTAENAHVLPVCCNVCRTCTTTNVVGLLFGAAAAAGVAVAAFARRAVARVAAPG